MLSPRLTNCPECANIPSLLKKINCKLAELGNSLYNNISYMLNQPIPAGEMLQLIAYRRILTHKYCNPNYVHHYSVAMIASRVIRITTGCVSKCNEPEPCIEVPCDITIVQNPTTTTTSTLSPPTTTTTSSSSTTTTTTSTTAIPTNQSPIRAVFDSNGNYFVSCFSAISLTKVTPSGVSSSFSNGLFSSPWGITIDSLDNLYVAVYNSARVYKITPLGTATILGITGSQPTAIAIDSLNNIYTVNQGPKTITKITPAGASSIFATIAFGQVLYMIIDQYDNIYISDENQDTVRKITPSAVVTTFATGITAARGMVFDSSDNLYVCANTTIKKITPLGVVSTYVTIPYTSPSQIEDLAIDDVGNIYCSDAGADKVYIIDTSGNLSIYGNTGDFPITVDVSPLNKSIWTVNNQDNTVTILN